MRLVSGNNHWIGWFTQPAEVILTLWLLLPWQPLPGLRRLYVTSIPLFGALSALVLVLTDPHVSYERWVLPCQALVALAAALQTGVMLALRSPDLLTEQDWFWICSGLALFWISAIPIVPFSEAYMKTHLELVRNVLMARAMLIPIAFALMTWGVLCKRPSRVLPGPSSVPV
jgi:hypothetical protein